MQYFVTEHIPPFRTYEDWARHEASVKPIRGRTYKPIARRSDWYMHMTRGEDGSITLHNGTSDAHSLRVTYNPDDTVTISNAGPWANEFRFIAETTGIQFKGIRSEPWLDLPGSPMVRIGRVTDSDGKTSCRSKMVPLHFRRAGNHWELMTEVETPTYYKLDIKAWNALRKRIAPYMQQFEVFCKMRADTFYARNYRYDSRTRTITVDFVDPQQAVPLAAVALMKSQVDDDPQDLPAVRCMEAEDLDQWVRLNVLLLSWGPVRYLSDGKQTRTTQSVVCVSSVVKYALEAAKREWRDDLFTRAPVTKPTHRRNENAKYFE